MKKITALVTGASGGIGKDFAQILAEKSINLVLVARGLEKLEQIKKELEEKYKIDVLIIKKDLSVALAAKEIYDSLQAKDIQIDILINNAGFGDYGKFAETKWPKELQMIQLNILALTELTKLFLPSMVQRKEGRILNLASTAAFQPGPLMSVYYATKAYVLMFSEGIANELKGTGVTVTALCPGPTESGFQSAASLDDSKLFKGQSLPPSKAVARAGIEAMLKGQTVKIPGFKNWIGAQTARFMPRKTVAALVRNIQEKAH